MSGTLAVVSQSGQTLSFFDITTGERTTHMTNLIAEPHELCFDPKRNLLYVSHTYAHGHFWVHGDCSHEITVIDLAKREIVDSIDISPILAPHGLVLDSQRDILYVSFEEVLNEAGTSGGLIGIDLQSRKVIKRIDSQYKSHWFVMTPDGKKAYTCNKTAPFISVLDLENECMLGKIPVPSCEEPGMSLDGKFAYFPTPGLSMGPTPIDTKIIVIDTTTDDILKSIPLNLGAQCVHVTSSGKIMVGMYRFDANAPSEAPTAKEGRLALYDPDTYALLGEAEIGLQPLTMRSSQDGRTGFVANIFSGTVTVVDLSSMTVLKTLMVDTKQNPDKKSHMGAHGMAFLP